MSRSRTNVAFAVVCVAVAALVLGATAAFGSQAHYYAGMSFGTVGPGAGELSLQTAALSEPKMAGSGLAVSESSHDVYVADTGNRRIDEFGSDGSFVRAFGWGVVDGESKLEVCTQGSGCRAGLSGSNPGELEVPVFVAVDNDASSASYGDIYVGDVGDNLITKFTAGGGLVESWGNNGSGGSANGQLNGPPGETFNAGTEQPIGGIAIDSLGHLSVVDFAYNSLFVFDQAGAFSTHCTEVSSFGSSIGEWGLTAYGSEKLFMIGGAGQVEALESDCKALGYVTTPGLGEGARGVTADSATGDLYVDNTGVSIEDVVLAGCVPGGTACAAGQVFGEGLLSSAAGVAVDTESGVVYAADAGDGRVVAFPAAVSATVSGAGGVTAHGATLEGAVNPHGAALSSCVFEYGEGDNVEHAVPCEESVSAIGSGNAAVPVHANIGGLTGGSAYGFRLRAANANGSVFSEPLLPFETATVARIEGSSGSELQLESDGSLSAAVRAKVNPEGVTGNTTCKVEYGVSSAYGSSLACEPGSLSGSVGVSVSAALSGLSAGVEYHWRVVAEDANGLAEGPDHTFVYLTGPRVQAGCPNEQLRSESNKVPGTGSALSSVLPDCRAYEMVTPPAKNGTVLNNAGLYEPPMFSRDGSRVMLIGLQCLASAASCDPIRQKEGQPYSLERGAGGWTTTPLAPPATSGITGDTFLTYNAETDRVIYALPEAPPALEQFYVRLPDGALRALGPIAEQPGPVSGIGLAGTSTWTATSDFSTFVYQSAGSWPSLSHAVGPYEYRAFGQSHPLLVGVSGGSGSTSSISACGADLGGELAGGAYGSLSADGRMVIFTAQRCSEGTGLNAGVPVPASTIYARVDASRTVLVSSSAPEPECDSACQAEPPANASFVAGSEDGSRVFFTSPRRLTNEASEDSNSHDANLLSSGCQYTTASASGCNLYEYECPNLCEDENTRRVIDVSASAVAGETPRVQQVVAVSRDGSHVYFVAKGALTSGANKAGQEPVDGAENMYMFERDGEYPNGHLAFIGSLSVADKIISNHEPLAVANITPDGAVLLFPSHRALTPDVTRREGPVQVYRYDAHSERLQRVSVGDQGFNDSGNTGSGDASIVDAPESYYVGGGRGRTDPSMSDDGSVVFFRSPIALAPGALDDRAVTGNPQVLAQNVYEWEQDGKGGCTQAEGCVSLISDGHDLAEGPHAAVDPTQRSAVRLLGTDPSGQDVFFETADQLVAGDTDTQIDVYDARVDGGFPAPAAGSSCETGSVASGGVSCRGSGSEPGLLAAPGSMSFSGPGNAISEEKTPAGRSTHRALTRVEKLKRALSSCRKRYRAKSRRSKRSRCERTARKRYGPSGQTLGHVHARRTGSVGR